MIKHIKNVNVPIDPTSFPTMKCKSIAAQIFRPHQHLNKYKVMFPYYKSLCFLFIAASQTLQQIRMHSHYYLESTKENITCFYNVMCPRSCNSRSSFAAAPALPAPHHLNHPKGCSMSTYRSSFLRDK